MINLQVYFQIYDCQNLKINIPKRKDKNLKEKEYFERRGVGLKGKNLSKNETDWCSEDCSKNSFRQKGFSYKNHPADLVKSGPVQAFLLNSDPDPGFLSPKNCKKIFVEK